MKESARVLRTERHFGKVAGTGQAIAESRSSAKFVDGVVDLLLPRKTAVAARKLAIE